MLCDCCHKNESVLFLEKFSGSNIKKINLCMECAKKYNFVPNQKDLEKNLSSLFSQVGGGTKSTSKIPSRLCPVCGQSLDKILHFQNVGCPECYAIFAKEIKDFLKSKNIVGEYTGQMPSRLACFRSRLTDRMDIQAKLEASLKIEDYEKAAMYRDYLRALENSSVSDGNAPLQPDVKNDN